MSKKDFSVFFKENKETISELKIPEKDFKRILSIFIGEGFSEKTIEELDKDIKDLKLSKPVETVTLICFNSLKKSFEDCISDIVYKNPEIVKETVSNLIKDMQSTLFKLFYILRSSENNDKQMALITFLSMLNILGFSNICDKSELVKFSSAICKKNNYDIQEILVGTFKSFYLYATNNSDLDDKPQNTNIYH